MESFFKEDIRFEVIDEILSVEGLPSGDYDTKAKFYDKVMSNYIYNKIMWGNAPQNYTDFAQKSIYGKNSGAVVDVGCGSLSFTKDIYGNYTERKLLLIDYSIEMLKIAKKRVFSHQRDNKIFLRATGLDLPINTESVQTVLSFGTLHIFKDPRKFLNELHRILVIGGDLHMNILCNDRKISAKYLKILKRNKVISSIMSSSEIQQLISSVGFETNCKVIGGMAYCDAIKA